MSIREELNQIIKERGRISFDEVEAWCKFKGHKTDTARRKLEPDQSPNVEAIYSPKGAVVGWKYVGVDVNAILNDWRSKKERVSLQQKML